MLQNPCNILIWICLVSLIQTLSHASISQGLVAWYPLDGNASDISVQGNHGVNHGATPTLDRHDRVDHAMLFNGTNAYIQAAYNPSISTSIFSYSLWAKPTENTSLHGSPLTFRSDGKGFTLYKNPSNIWSYWIGNGGWVAMGTQTISHSWTSLAFTYDGSIFKAYQNGALVTSLTQTYRVNLSKPLRIGAGSTERTYPRYYFKGAVDEVRIYNRSLSASEISTLYSLENSPPNSPPVDLNANTSLVFPENSAVGSIIGQFTATGISPQSPLTFSLIGTGPTRESDLIGWFKFDEGTGNTSENFGSQGSDATLENSATFSTTEKKFGLASLHIPDASQNAYAKLTTPIPLGSDTSSSPYSISAWFKQLYPAITWRTLFRGRENNHPIIVSDSNDRIGVFNNLQVGFRDSGYDLSPAASSNTWQHVAATFNGTNTTIYIDGVQVGIAPNSPGNNVYAIGNYQGGDQRFAKYLDDFRVYGRILSAAEISQIYGDGNGDLFASSSYFTIDPNGTLRTKVSMDYENHATTMSIRVRVTDELNASTDESFTVSLSNVVEDPDGDGIENHIDLDDDNDGFTDLEELQSGTDSLDAALFPTLTHGLLAWYPFEGNASDRSENNRDGILTGNPAYAHAIQGQAINLDGIDDYMEIPNDSSLDPRRVFTYSFWFKSISQSKSWTPVLYKGSLSGKRTYAFWLNEDSKTLHPVTRDSSGQQHADSSTNFWNHNRWYSIVVSMDRNTGFLKLYVDGQLLTNTSIPKSDTVSNSNALRLGWTNENNDNYVKFKGLIDNLRLYNRVLFAADVDRLYTLESKSQPTNTAPHSLAQLNALSFSENAPSGTLIGEFNATDSDAESSLTYQLISGAGSDHNSLFSLESNGRLKNFAVFDFETNSSSYTIRVQVRDEFNATSEGNFTISLSDQFEDLDGDGQEDHLDSDRDGDGLSNSDEISYGSDPDDRNSTVNLPPHSLAISQIQFNENLPVGSTIANLSAIDPNQDNLSFSLLSFSPLDLNPVLWLDADDPTTISTSSGKISGWDDKSGGNHNFAQSNSQLRPVLRQNKINGRPAVKFDGRDDFLSLNSRMGLSANPALTMSAVLINQTNSMTDQRVFQFGGSDLNIIGISTGFHGWAWRFNGGNRRFGNVSNLQTHVASWVRSAGSNFQQSSFYLNGTQQSSVAGSGSAYPTNTLNFSTLGSGSGTGSSSPTLAFNGFLGEFIILNSSSVKARESIENYLSNKWGLGASLPTTSDGFLLESNGTLKTSASFDFESNQSTYPIWVRAMDEQNQSVEGNFTLSLVDLFEDLDGDSIEDHADTDDDGDGFPDLAEIAYGSNPRDPNSVANAAPDSLELNGSTILENQAPHTLVGHLTASDPDPNANLSFSFTDGNGSDHNALFQIHQNQILRSLHSFDFETNASTYSIRVRVSDQHEAKLERIFLISLLNQLEDFDGDGIEDYFDPDEDGDGFSDSVEIAYGSDPRDSNSVANTAPDSLELNGSTILENQAPNTVVGQLTASDPDANATLTLSLVDGNGSKDNAFFAIDANGSLVTLFPFDFETNASSYPIRVRVSDQHGAKLERIFLISLLNQVEDLDSDGIEDYFDPDDDGDGFMDLAEVAYGSDPRDPNSVANAAPDSLELNGSTILENQAPNTVVGQLIATDPDANATLSFSFTDGNGSKDNSLFSIDDNGSLVTLFPFDFETNASTYPIRVRVSDQHGANLERIFLVSLLNQVEDLDRDGIEDYFDPDDDGDGFSDLFESESGTNPLNPTSIPNQAPSSISFSTRSFPENLPVGSIIGKFTATDPDANATLTLSLVDGNGSKDNALFAIDANGSLFTLFPFDFETNASNYSIRVQVRDEWNASLEENFHLLLEDLDENAPVLTLLGPAEITLTTGTGFRDPGAVWMDDREGNGTTYAELSDFNVSKAGTYTLIYAFSDRAGNLAKDLNRTLIVRDPALPLVRTLTAQLDGNDSLSLHAELLDSGGLEIAEIGVEIGTRPSLSGGKFHPLQPEAETGFYSTILPDPPIGVELFYRAYAINRMGIAHGSVHKIQLPQEVDPNIWWTQALIHEGGWRTLDWFGTFLLSDEEYWVYHAQLGWIYLVSDDSGGIWMWKQGLGWLWTSEASAPFYWLNSSSSWLYPLLISLDRQIFWDYAREQALRLP